MSAVSERDDYLLAGSAFAALNLLNVLLWTANLYLPVGFWLALLLACLWQFVRKQALNGLVGIGFLMLCVLIAVMGPATGWDARSIWLFHAKRIFLDGSLYAQLDDYAANTHNEYPVMVPAIAASLARAMGRWNEIVPRASVAIAMAPPLFFAAHLFRSLAAYLLWISLLLLVCMNELLSGYMDSLVAMNFALGLVAVADIYRRGAERAARLPAGPALILSATLVHLLFLKNEGSVIAGLLSAAMVPATLRRPRLTWYLLIPWVVFALVWKLPVSHAHIVSDLLSNGSLLDRGLRRIQSPADVFLILHFFRLLSQDYFIVLAVLIAAAVIGWRRLWFVMPSVMVVAAYAVILFVVFLTTHFELRWHLNTAADRVLMAFDLGASSLLLYLLSLGVERLPAAWRPITDSGA